MKPGCCRATLQKAVASQDEDEQCPHATHQRNGSCRVLDDGQTPQFIRGDIHGASATVDVPAQGASRAIVNIGQNNVATAEKKNNDGELAKQRRKMAGKGET